MNHIKTEDSQEGIIRNNSNTYYETLFSSFSPGQTHQKEQFGQEGQPPSYMKLVDEDRAALNRLIWQMHNSKDSSPIGSPASHETQKMVDLSPINSENILN